MANSQYVEVKKTDTKQSYCLILSAQRSQQAKLVKWPDGGYVWKETVPGGGLCHFWGSGPILISWTWLWFLESVHFVKNQWVIY